MSCKYFTFLRPLLETKYIKIIFFSCPTLSLEYVYGVKRGSIRPGQQQEPIPHSITHHCMLTLIYRAGDGLDPAATSCREPG